MLASAIICVPLASGCSNEKNNKTESSLTNSNVTSDQDSVQPGADNSTPQKTLSQSKITPAMWKVENKNGNYIYMFGTIHAADGDASVMPDYFESAYNDSQAIAVEADVSDMINDPTLTAGLMKYIMYTDGTTIRDHISAEIYDGVSTVLKNNSSMYIEQAYDVMTPMAWSSALESAVVEKCGLDVKNGIDLVTTNRAKNDAKEVLEVESVESQMEMFERLSDNVGELMLMSYTSQEDFDKQVEQMKKLYGDWKAGSAIAEEEINPEILEDVDEETKKALEYYNDEMLLKRNPKMADKAEQYLSEGKKVLFMVGAAHFYGDNGLINLMQTRGYTVTRISPEITEQASLPAAA